MSKRTNLKSVFVSKYIILKPDITIGNKCVFFKSWFENGVHFVGDLMRIAENLTLYNYNDFCKVFNFNPNCLLFLWIMYAVKRYIKLKPSNGTCFTKQVIPNSLWSILVNTKGTKPMYEIIAKDESLPMCIDKWSNIFYFIETKYWRHIFEMPFLITQDTSLQWFQNRIIHRIIVTNSFF